MCVFVRVCVCESMCVCEFVGIGLNCEFLSYSLYSHPVVPWQLPVVLEMGPLRLL